MNHTHAYIQDSTKDVSSLLPSIPSTFYDFSVLMGMATNLDLKAFFEYDNKMRKKLGPLRYFFYPLLLEKLGDGEVRIRYADRQDDHQNGVCRFDCPRCDHFDPTTSTSDTPSPPPPAHSGLEQPRIGT